MENHYLYISKRSDGKIEVNSSDGVFSSYATVESKEAFRTYCEGKVNEWLKSKVRNYSHWNVEKRKVIANKWRKAKTLSEGKYDYYFTTESKEDIFRKEVERLQKELIKEKEKGLGSDVDDACILELQNVLTYIDSLQEEPVSKDLEEAAVKYAQDKHLPVQTWQAFKAGAQWQKEHLWKDIQGDDLPEIDREVIALIEAFGHYKVISAHRVAENAEIHTSIEGKPCVLHPKRYDKGGWNIPGIKWWLDIELPKTEE